MSRKVTRVLVMLEYGPGDSNNGEVFDLTALVSEMLPKASYRARINLEVQAAKSYDPDPVKREQPVLEISWGGDAGNWVHGATHLEDVINAALPDGERVTGIKNKAKRLRKKADELDDDAMRAKLEQVAAIRSQYPIARVTSKVALPGAPANS